MRKTRFGIAASVLVVLAGCTQGNPGGPGVQSNPNTSNNPSSTTTSTTRQTDTSNRQATSTNQTTSSTPSTTRPATNDSSTTSTTQSADKPVISNSKETFSLKTPTLATSLKQGETKTADISISRGSDFKEDVSLRFSAVPEGITLDPMTPTLKASEDDVKIKVTAADNAALGDFRIKVIGHPNGGGADADNDFKVTVSAK